MSSLFKKPKRNFRKKISEHNSDDENSESTSTKKENIPFLDDNDESSMDVDQPPKITPSNGSKKEKKKKRAKEKEKSLPVSSALSFDHDEEADTEVFKVKKSNQSRRLAKQLKKEKIDTNIEIKEEKKPRDKELSDENPEDIHKEKDDEKLRQLREEFRTMNGDDAENLEGSDDEDGQHTFRKMLARGEIPDAKTIHMIRKQRMQARNDDFLPLDDEEKAVEKKKESRLVRDDEHDRSDDEEEERVDFTLNTAARERQRMRDEFLAAEHGSDEESDHDREWEAQQIRKAALMPGQETIQYDHHSNSNSYTDTVENYNSNNTLPGSNISSIVTTSFKPFKSLARTGDNITVESVRKRLQDRMSELDTVYRGHKMEYEKLETEVEDGEKEIEDCQYKIPELEKQYKFYQEMRGYVRDLVECLNEKVPVINDFENRMKTMLRQRADLLIQRRQQDVRDQCQDYMTSRYLLTSQYHDMSTLRHV